jgi:predicted transcriptional regulator
MYGSFLSYIQLNEYMSFLLDKDLISYQQQKKETKPKRDFPLLMITEKGTHFMSRYNRMNEMILDIIQTK